MRRKKYGDKVSVTARMGKDVFIEMKIAAVRAELPLSYWIEEAILAKLQAGASETEKNP